MKAFFKILLIFAVLGSVLPYQEISEYIQTGSAEHNCCDNDFQDKGKHNSCSLLCQCYNNISPINITPNDLFLDIIFIQHQIDANQYTEGQTEPIFRPPKA
jgi:hypothetical protein